MLHLHRTSLAHTMCTSVLASVTNVITGAISSLAAATPAEGRPKHLLDIGCWDGTATTGYAAAAKARPAGIEVYADAAARAAVGGVQVVRLDLERDSFPWRDAVFDIVVANQVFEHLKNIWLPLAEAFRVLRPGGHLIISVPNLASLHNRVLLLCGVQPTSIRVLGPHVRGYTVDALVELLSLGDALRHCKTIGAGFYPFPAPLDKPCARLWPRGSHTMVVVMRKVEHRSPSPWLPLSDEHAGVTAQTHYP